MALVEIENYTKKLKGKTILKNISLSFDEGKVYKLKGANGCGKTMLLRAIAGLIYPTEGQITVDGKVLSSKTEYPKRLGVLIENPIFWKNYTGYEVLDYLAKIRNEIGREDIEYAMERVGLDPCDKRIIGKYSLGMKQKLGIAQAIMEHPDILLLDEPVNALDKKSIEKLMDIVGEERENGTLVIIAIHNSGDFVIDYDGEIELYEGEIVNE